MLLNPSTSNFYVSFSSTFYNEDIDKRYNDYLFHQNSPIKEIVPLIIESIQSLEIPGDDMNTIVANNLGGINGQMYTYPGTTNDTENLESTILNITSRNLLMNYMRLYEFKKGYYARKRTTELFDINITFCDSANVPMLNFCFVDCFIRGMPGLTFAFNSEFNESKTFDWKVQFSNFTPTFIIPDFNKQNIIV